MLYSCVVPQARQAASPASAKVCAPQLAHEEAELVTVQEVAGTEPAEHARQAEHGARPVDDQVELATHGREHALVAVFHA